MTFCTTRSPQRVVAVVEGEPSVPFAEPGVSVKSLRFRKTWLSIAPGAFGVAWNPNTTFCPGSSFARPAGVNVTVSFCPAHTAV